VGLSKLKFLAVEDHEFQRGMLLKMLARLGATQVSTAADGYAALEILMSPGAAIDIIISDLDMPGMDGLEFMRHVGEAHIPVAIILASALESVLLDSVETMTRAYGVKILGVIQKPITPEKLGALIKLHIPAQVNPNLTQTDAHSFTVEEIVQGIRNDEFEPFFQPKVELASGLIKGAESLARWRHPQKGIVAPYAFVGPLEGQSQIDKLTWLILRKSVDFCCEWRTDSGLDVSVSVNVSAKSLADVNFAECVTELVKRRKASDCPLMTTAPAIRRCSSLRASPLPKSSLISHSSGAPRRSSPRGLSWSRPSIWRKSSVWSLSPKASRPKRIGICFANSAAIWHRAIS